MTPTMCNPTHVSQENRHPGVEVRDDQAPSSSANNRNVTFRNQARVCLIPSHHDLTDEEFLATWISPEEDEASRENVLRCVMAMRRSPEKIANDDGDLCTRGLEHLQSKEHSEDKKAAKKRVIMAVLNEQYIQKMEGTEDAENIAIVSAAVSRWSRQKALRLAASDAEYVHRTYIKGIPSSRKTTVCQSLSQQATPLDPCSESKQKFDSLAFDELYRSSTNRIITKKASSTTASILNPKGTVDTQDEKGASYGKTFFLSFMQNTLFTQYTSGTKQQHIKRAATTA